MGATVTTGRNVGAFRTPAGQTLYVLFERTYEKNCYPHKPSWCSVGFGSLHDVMRRIFQLASECEGGMLQNSKGWIEPESYLRSWLKELARPYLMPDQGHELVLGKGFYSTIREEKFGEVKAALGEIGREDIASRLEAGEAIPAWLYKDAGVLVTLYGVAAKVLPPWLFLSHRPAWTEADRAPELGFKPSGKAQGGSSFEIPTVRAVGEEEERFLEQPDGSFKPAGATYAIVENFIENLWEEALRSPSSCYERIAAYREAIHSAPRFPLDEVKVSVDATAPMKERGRRDIAAFASRFPVVGTRKGFEVIPTKENFYSLTYLPEKAVRWIIGVEAPAEEALAAPLGFVNIQHAVQLSLF